MDSKKTILDCIFELFFMFISVGLLMEDLKFVGAVVLLGVFGHSMYTLFKVIREGRRHDKN